MSNNKKLVPELRFPEFKDLWNTIILADYCDIYRGSTFSKSDINDNGDISCIHYGQLFTKYDEVILNVISKTNIKVGFTSKVGDILMPSSDVTPDGLAKASALMVENVILGGDMNVIRPNQDINSIYLSYLLNYSKNNIIKLVSGTTVKHIYPSQIINLQLPFVKNLEEQQKIASCLSSLDDVIAGYNDKLDVLKEQKKGLLQNLFPQEGERVPRFRFKEFEGDGEWIEKRLGDIGNPLMCKRIFKEETTISSANNIPFYKIGTFGKQADSFIDKNTFLLYKNKFSYPNVGDILISAAGTIGRLVVFDGSPAYFQDSNIVWLGNDETKLSNSFLIHIYSNTTWQTSDGGIVRRLYNADLKNIKIIFPKNKKEQQKIADSLSSLDVIIKEQADKIEQLKLHKKGLMQGLFPNVN